jgi:splicing factor U2AF subunit
MCVRFGVRKCCFLRLQYEEEEQAEKALNALNGRFYAGRLLMAEYSPVTDFRE